MTCLASPSNSVVLVIGVGNPYRSDDGVGLVVARRIRELNIYGVAVMEETGEATRLIEFWSATPNVFLIDAVHSGAEPGTVHRIDAIQQNIPSDYFFYSTHAFGVAAAIELARSLYRLPPRLIVYGIEGNDFSDKPTLSVEVEESVSRAIEALVQEITPIAAFPPTA
jgi:hydrogenase maturation protease